MIVDWPDGVYIVRSGKITQLFLTEKGLLAFQRWFTQLEAEEQQSPAQAVAPSAVTPQKC